MVTRKGVVPEPSWLGPVDTIFAVVAAMLVASVMLAIRGYRNRDPVAILLSTSVILPLLFFLQRSFSARAGDSWPLLVWPIAWGSFQRPSGEDAAREWDQHFLLELGELRTQTTDLRGDVAELRREVAQLRRECDRRLPPLAEPP